MAHPEIEEWLNTAEGVPMDPDGAYGNQCVDLVDQYGQDIFGVPWNVCVGGVVGAKQLLDAAPDKYWIRVDNDPNDPNLVPPRGAVVVTGGDYLNQWGHTYACLGADVNGVDAIQQDGFAAPTKFVNGGWYSNKPAHRARLPYAAAGMGTTLGWLIPREEMLAGYVAPAVTVPVTSAGSGLLGYQRTTVPDAAVGYRKGPDAGAELISWLDPDHTYDFKGFVTRNGQTWFVGRYSGGFSWAGGFLDEGTHDLPDLTAELFPAPAPAANKRITGADGVNRRKVPDKNGDLIDTFGAEKELTLAGYVTGTEPYPNAGTVWFVGGISGGYMHSSGFTDQSTTGLPLLPTPDTVWTPTSPAPKPVYDFVPDFDWVEKRPAALSNVELGRAPGKDKPTVIHQMGTPGVDTLGSTINEFQRENSFKSSHFGVENGRAVQMVSLKDRAYHAGAVGNDGVGIETDPHQSPETIATTKRILAALKALGYSTVTIRHKDVAGNNTSCGTLIDLTKYVLTDAVTPPVTGPESPITIPDCPAPSPDAPTKDGDPLEKFVNWLGDDLLNRFRKENK